nr:PREDICTED: uncharacterized protein LOC100881008 isoform X2 [Megachile rotundata]
MVAPWVKRSRSGVRVPTNEDQWKNGPEYTFNASLGMVTSMEVDKGQPMGSNMFVTLKCRPKEPTRLHCRFENARIAKFVPEKFEAEASMPPANATFSDFGFGNASFEILFNEDGIENYKFENDDRQMGDYLVNMYRLIANHLSVGVKFRKDVPSPLRKLENSSVGECNVTYNVSRRKLDQPISIEEFQLVWLPDQRIDPEQETEITRETHLSDCLIHSVYFFGTRHTFGIVPVGSMEKLQSSTGRIIISSSNFTSESTNKVDVYNTKRKMIGSVLDHIRLTLVSVTPLTSDFKEITNPMNIGPILNKSSIDY